jgi:hypothetical protein
MNRIIVLFGLSVMMVASGCGDIHVPSAEQGTDSELNESQPVKRLVIADHVVPAETPSEPDDDNTEPSPTLTPKEEKLLAQDIKLVDSSEPLFRLDTQTAVYEYPVTNAIDLTLKAEIADGDGRRKILLKHDFVDDAIVIADAGWHLFPAAALSKQGMGQIVCFNRLVGTPTEMTAGAMPDPTHGVHLYCRVFMGTGWSPELRVAADAHAAWLRKVEVTPNGYFVITAYHDDGWFMGRAKEGHGTYAHMYDSSGHVKSELIHAAEVFESPSQD